MAGSRSMFYVSQGRARFASSLPVCKSACYKNHTLAGHTGQEDFDSQTLFGHAGLVDLELCVISPSNMHRSAGLTLKLTLSNGGNVFGRHYY